MVRSLKIPAALVAWLLLGATLFAQADPLAVIPDDALGVVVINRLADTNERIHALTEKMKLPLPEMLPMAKNFVGVGPGLDEKGGIAAAGFVDGEQDELVLVYFVPVTDFKEFIAPLKPADTQGPITEVTIFGETYLAGKKGSFAVVTAEHNRARLEKVLASTNNVSQALAPLKTWIDQQQVALALTPAGKSLLAKKILSLLPEEAADDKKKDEKDADADDDADDDASVPLTEIIKIGRVLAGKADQELTHLAVGVRIDDTTALHVAVRLVFKTGGELAAWAKNVKLPAESLLAGLPAGKYTVAYAAVSAQLSPEIAGIVNQFTEMGLQQFGLDVEDRKKVEEALNRQRANQINSKGLLGTMRPGGSIFSTAIAVERVKNSKDYLKSMRDMVEALGAAVKSKETGESLYQITDVTVGDLKAMEMTTNFGALVGGGGDDNPAAAQVQGMFGWMFGQDGKIKTYFTALDDHTVVTAYSQEQLLRAVAHLRSGEKGLETDASIAKTTALLPEGAQWVAYISPQGLLQWIDAILRQVGGGESPIKLPPFPESEPIGLAARVSPTALDAEVVLPDSVVAGIGRFIFAAQQMFQNGGVPLP